MAESIYSDGQNQQVPSQVNDSGRPPTLITPNLDSPLSQVSSEDLDFTSPDGPSKTNPGNPRPENKMDTSIGSVGDRSVRSMDSDSLGPGGDAGSPRRAKTMRTETDIMKLSAMSGDGYTDSLSSSRPASAASSRSPYKEKEAERRVKEREKEEKVRLARQRMAEERQKKLIELKEQQRIAQENRERQLQLRRKKIEELRRREDERRAAVEERRLRREATERSKREAILQRASERMTRYEAWKTGGRKGGSGGVSGFGSRTPRDICKPSDRPNRSSSHSALIRRSPNSSDCGYMSPQRRAISACSSVRRHCCVDINRTGQNPGAPLPPSKHLSVSTSVLYHKRNPEFSSTGGGLNHAQPGSLLALNTIPEGRRSFLAPTSSPPQRPKSTVTLNTATSGTTVKFRENKSPRKPRPASVATSMPSFMSSESPKVPSQRSLSTDRLAKEKRQKMQKEDTEEKPKSMKPTVKFNRHSMDRLSTPKQHKDPMTTSVELPKRDPIIKRSPRKAYSTTNLAMPRKSLPANVKLSKETPARLQKGGGDTEDKKIAVVKPSPSTGGSKTTSSMPPIKQSLTPLAKPQPAANSTPKPAPTPAVTVDPPKDEQKDVEDYKARLAERRRLAREKAEKEAEEERRKQEIFQLQEEERQRQEEEEQRKMEEEALRLAEEARKIEEERLQKAIEAEEKRREEEAKRLEEERIAKEMADQKAQEEAERMERERLERAKKEEVERVERKKRLEMIMKRVKTDGPSDTSRTESPNKSISGSPSKSTDSLNENEDKQNPISNSNSEEEISRPALDTIDAAQFQTPDRPTDGDKPRFRSPLLQQMVENKSDSPSNDRPKFKSPLLQNLLGKTKVGARIGLEKAHEESKAGEILNTLRQKETLSFSSSQSLTNLSQTSDSLADKEALEKNMSKSVFNINMKDEDKDIDTTESENSSIVDAKEADAGQNYDQKSVDEDLGMSADDENTQLIDNKQFDNSDTSVHTNGFTDYSTDQLVEISTENGQVEEDINKKSVENGVTLKGGADSGVLMDLGESGTSLHSIPVNGSMLHDLIDSSISMQSVDSNVSENISKDLPSRSNDFEEFIDLSVPSKNVDLKTNQLTDSLVKEASNDLLNFNNIEESEEQENRTPFIAFEDNTNRKQDVPDLLS
ncbi:ensconsin isoform X2 [Patella vulgata]|uniref:ensconsin isoform X2 n=1 Tax=Patella vulgata TaxID=6465 RepID=UPI00217F74C2|nr:ensconsin isoform X2 [Patella vulgata]